MDKNKIEPQDRTIRNTIYTEKRVNGLSTYNAYWCLFYLRFAKNYKYEKILKDDKQVKLKLMNYFIIKNSSIRSVDLILRNAAVNSIPLDYIKWFYNDQIAALWLYMVLKERGLVSHKIILNSDIDIFVNDLIFNLNIPILNNILVKQIETTIELSIYNKISTFSFLERAYLTSKVGKNNINWLNRKYDVQINHLYKYMAKIHDIDNPYSNKANNNRSSYLVANRLRPLEKRALNSSDTIKFPDSDTNSRLKHMIASLEYYVFNSSWFGSEHIILEEIKVANRSMLISKMKDAWKAKDRRDENKKAKEKGLLLTPENKKLLKIIAKKQGKTQLQMLNDIVTSYSQNFIITLPKNAEYANAHVTGDYGQRWVDTFLIKEAKNDSSKYTLATVDSDDIQDENRQTDTIESTLSVEKSNDDKTEVPIESNGIDDKSQILKDVDGQTFNNPEDKSMHRNSACDASKATIQIAKTETGSHINEDSSGSIGNSDSINESPGVRNARIVNDRLNGKS